MVSKTLKEKEKELRREHIIEAAAKLFLEKGYDETTMNQIAKEAHFTKMTIYAYFNSKEELHSMCVLKSLEKLWEKTDKVFQTSKSNYEKLKDYAQLLYSHYTDYKEELKLTLYVYHNPFDYSKISEDISKEFYSEMNKRRVYLHNTFENGIKDGEFVEDMNIQQVRKFFFITIHAILFEVVYLGYEDKSFYDAYVDLFLKSLKK